ncbi:MAG: ribonuclease P protein component [Spirochaetaceae bacterium]|nr:ribonuclease P protein component [Spirochaetaceae bacterium]
MDRDFRFRRHEHLRAGGDIKAVFKRGRVVSCPGAKLFIVANGLAYNRIVFTFARKFGNAVKRNRARRLGREAYRLLRASLKTGFDLALLVYPGEDSLEARMEQLTFLFSRGRLLTGAHG